MEVLKKITKAENDKNVPHLKITEVALVYYDIVNNDYQQGLWVLYTFVPNKLFGQLSDISPVNFMSLKSFNSEFPYIEIWLTGQKLKALEMEGKICINLVID